MAIHWYYFVKGANDSGVCVSGPDFEMTAKQHSRWLQPQVKLIGEDAE